MLCLQLHIRTLLCLLHSGKLAYFFALFLELLTKLLLLRIARETVSNVVIYWTHSFHISLLEHYVHQVLIYSLYLTVSRLLPHLVLSE